MDELSAPLGRKPNPKKKFTLPVRPLHALAGVFALFLATIAGFALTADDPLGGEPVAIASTKRAAEEEPAAKKPEGATIAAADNSATATPPPGAQTINIIDGVSGKSQQVVIGNTGNAGSSAEQKLLEKTRHGDVPRIAADGTRPSSAYARVLKLPAGKTDAPRIAVIVTGLGISAKTTGEALAKLPGPVSFAFTPYGNDIDKLVARARADGHEVLLQTPMEPLDYPDNDPGPQTLLTAISPEQNIDRLYWLMSRFTGFVGITNYMGARFTVSDQAMSPVLREVARRGLIYVDDGTAPRSIAGQIAGASNMPFAKSDIVIDAVPTPAEIDRALGRLEAQARERGAAVGTLSALPGAINRVAEWAKKVESRGFVLVPITAVAIKPKSS